MGSMMSGGHLPSRGGIPTDEGPPSAGADPAQGEMITCPNCHSQFSEAEAAGAGEMPPDAAGAPQQAPTDGTCPECGGKMAGGSCPQCGYSGTNSPMTNAATDYLKSRPADERPNVKDVVDQGRRVREHMRRPAPYGRG